MSKTTKIKKITHNTKNTTARSRMIAEKGKEREILIIIIQPTIWKKYAEGISEPNKRGGTKSLSFSSRN